MELHRTGHPTRAANTLLSADDVPYPPPTYSMSRSALRLARRRRFEYDGDAVRP
mgnify:CR=1 FL=1